MLTGAFLLAVAVTTTTGEVAAPIIATPDTHLRPSTCATDRAADEVLVCSRKDVDFRYRLKPVEQGAYADRPLRAEMKLGNGTLRAHVTEGLFGSKRAMITFTVPF